MKLSSHYNRVSILISLVVLFAGALIYYFAIHQIARNQLDNELAEELGERMNYVNRYKALPQKDFDDNITIFKGVNISAYPTRFFDTVYYSSREGANENGRAVVGLIKVNDRPYLTTVIESYDSINDLMQLITFITLGLMVFLLLILFVANKFMLQGLWRPFYSTLHALNTFSISDTAVLSLKHNEVDEFTALNTAVQKMALRVKKDYEHLKQFTENASHEMMTPLAVITSKLDTLIQNETLHAAELDQINDIYAAAGKLSRLNQSLLLLVKIENNLIDDVEPLDMNDLVCQKIKQFQELASARDIQVQQTLGVQNITASKYLVDIMLNNLFSNALRHNVLHGRIVITLTTKTLTFQNTGAERSLDKETLFERFQKGAKSDGSGLGLTIIKNICSMYNWQISYEHRGLLHTFMITF